MYSIPSQMPMPSHPSPNLRALMKYVESLKEWDSDKILSFFDDDLEHHTIPSSMGRPVLNKQLYATYWRTAVMPMFQPGSFKVSLWFYVG